MVQSGRIENVSFSQTDLTSNAGGIVSAYADQPICGEIKKVVFNAVDYSANGSIALRVSGTGELLWLKKGNANADSVHYPFVYGEDNTGTTGSPQAHLQRVVGHNDGILEVWGSGCGSAKKASLEVYYG